MRRRVAYRDAREDAVCIHVLSGEALGKVLGVQVRVLALIDEAVIWVVGAVSSSPQGGTSPTAYLMTSMGMLMSATESFWA